MSLAASRSGGADMWRQVALGRFVENRILVRPWARLTSLDLGHNEYGADAPIVMLNA